jgi:uncharacterized protein (TIGR02145 family)
LNGTVDPKGSSTTVTFEYGTTTGYGTPVTATESQVTGTVSTSVSANLTGLKPNTVYHYRVKAENCGGPVNGSDEIFQTGCTAPNAPTVGTITQPTCTVTTGSVALSSLPATGKWTLTRTPGGTTTSGTGTSTTVSGLPAGTTYTFTVTNASGCISSASGNVAINTQQTSPTAPVVGTITQPTCSVTTGSVALSSLPATGNWTLTRTPGGTTSTGTGTSTTISGLPAGTAYTFTVTNASGCISSASGSIAIGAQPTAPSATTSAATSISSTTATLNGTVNANGASTTVTFLYGETSSYGSTSTASQSPVSGSSNTSVSAGITGLKPNTEYHYQVVAENCKGQKPGSDQQFTTTSGCSDAYETNNTIATANTTAFSSLGSSNYTNTIYGTIDLPSDIDYYRLNIATAGIITINSYSPGADRDITLYDANGEQITYSGHGYRESIFYPVTTTGYYYIKVSVGVHSCLIYNLEVNWGPGANTGAFTDYRDNKVYQWVYIGTQFWMAENLNVGTRINGSQDQTDNGTIQKYCYNDSESNCTTYGGLYQWDEMMQYSTYETATGVCPEFWHVPSDAEWTILTTHLGGIDVAGGKMKEAGTMHWTSPNEPPATNESGFTGLPGSYRSQSTGLFVNFGTYALFWSSTEYNTTTAWGRGLYNLDGTVYVYSYPKGHGFSVRCIKD